MYQPPTLQRNNGSLTLFHRNSPGNGLLLDYRHRIPLSQHSMNPMRNKHADDTISSLAIFPIKNHRIMVLSALPVSRNCRLIVAGVTPTPNLLGQDTRAPHLIRALSPAVTLPCAFASLRMAQQHYGATSLQAVLPSPPPQTIDGLQAGPSTALRPPVISSASSTTSTIRRTGAVHMSSAIWLDRIGTHGQVGT